jgi:hypothetical protein
MSLLGNYRIDQKLPKFYIYHPVLDKKFLRKERDRIGRIASGRISMIVYPVNPAGLRRSCLSCNLFLSRWTSKRFGVDFYVHSL